MKRGSRKSIGQPKTINSTNQKPTIVADCHEQQLVQQFIKSHPWQSPSGDALVERTYSVAAQTYFSFAGGCG